MSRDGGDDPQSAPPPGSISPDGEPTPEQVEAMMAQMQAQLLETPANVIVRDHAATFYQLAGLHLSQDPPDFAEASIAIDAMAALLDGLNGRIPDEDRLREALDALRLAFIQLKGSAEGDIPGDPAGRDDPASSTEEE